MASRKRKKPNQKLLTCKFPVVEQKFIIQLKPKPKITTTQLPTLSDEVLLQHINLPSIYFVHAYHIEYNNLVFDTALATLNTDYELYPPAVLKKLGKNLAIHRIGREIY